MRALQCLRALRGITHHEIARHVEMLEGRVLLSTVTLGQQPGAPDSTQFHGDATRTGFDQNETFLTPTNVASSFGQAWESPVLDGHVYATPLYQDSVTIQGPGNAANHAGDGVQSPSFQNQTLGVVFAATSGGSLYAIAAQDTNGPTGIAPGTILWKTHLGNPYGSVDGNTMGVLSTPIIDVKSNRIYVTAQVTDYLLPASDPNHGLNNWEVFALNLNDGSVVPGWPAAYTQALLNSLNQNKLDGGNTVVFSPTGADQRGALNLSADGSTLYVDFACYGATNPGWMTTVATGISNGAPDGQIPAVMSTFSGADTPAIEADGGMWGAGGPAIDANGNVFVTTGDSPGGTGQTPGAFGNSVLEWAPGQTLKLIGVYTPWNFQNQDTIDSDLGGSSPILINLPPGSSTTTELLATGGKQGNGYLVDAGNNLNDPTPNPNNSPAPYPASLTVRPPVVAPDQDPSLYDPTLNEPYFTPPQPGPLALFQPYNESSASGNTAKARDTPATFTGPDGTQYVIWAGASKSAVGSSTPIAPSLYLTKIVATPGQPAYLSIVTQNSQVMSLPGAGLITGDGTANEIDWVVDAGVQRTDNLTNFNRGDPTLYAYNALTMQPLWSSAYQQLDLGGKYNSMAVVRGDVLLGTDRIQAFGLTTDTIVDDAVTGTGPNQFNYVGTSWAHSATTQTMGTFLGTVSTTTNSGDFATLTFTGSAISVYANESPAAGSVTISVDGANSQTVSLANVDGSPNFDGEGDALVYGISGLSSGSHTLKFLDASGTVALDRVEITPTSTAPALGISLTDGNVTAERGGVLPYTINYNNAGSIVAGTGINATAVVITETVPAGATADLTSSTPGWVLTSGDGTTGSTYQFSIGNLNAGVTGSVVFSVDVSPTIPASRMGFIDNVSISDAASDTSSASRTTKVGAIVGPTTLTAMPGNDSFTLKQDPDHQHIDWTLGATSGSLPINDPAQDLTLIGDGDNDTVFLDYSNGSPLPGTLHLSGTFTLTSLQGTNPLAGKTLDIGRSTVFIRYGSSDPIAAIQSYLKNGYNAGAWSGTPTAATGVITSAAVQTNPNHTTAVSYSDSSDGQSVNTTPNTIELTYTPYGDANLDHQVNSADLQILLAFLNRAGSWDEGDFNYDGQINSADLQSLLFTLNTSLGNQTASATNAAPTPTALHPVAQNGPKWHKKRVRFITKLPTEGGRRSDLLLGKDRAN
jgi:hypothetical protein